MILQEMKDTNKFNQQLFSMSIEDLKSLEVEAATRNKELKVSGFLVYDGFHFFQYIEGLKGVIEELYKKIQVDDRHTSVTTLSEGSLGDLLFTTWGMKTFMPGDFVASDRVHIIDILSRKHDSDSIVSVIKDLSFRHTPALSEKSR